MPARSRIPPGAAAQKVWRYGHRCRSQADLKTGLTDAMLTIISAPVYRIFGHAPGLMCPDAILTKNPMTMVPFWALSPRHSALKKLFDYVKGTKLPEFYRLGAASWPKRRAQRRQGRISSSRCIAATPRLASRQCHSPGVIDKPLPRLCSRQEGREASGLKILAGSYPGRYATPSEWRATPIPPRPGRLHHRVF